MRANKRTTPSRSSFGSYKGRPTEYASDSKTLQKRLVYQTVVKQLKQGDTVAEIATENGLSRPTVYKKKRIICRFYLQLFAFIPCIFVSMFHILLNLFCKEKLVVFSTTSLATY